jgi:hypothetical protein
MAKRGDRRAGATESSRDDTARVAPCACVNQLTSSQADLPTDLRYARTRSALDPCATRLAIREHRCNGRRPVHHSEDRAILIRAGGLLAVRQCVVGVAARQAVAVATRARCSGPLAALDLVEEPGDLRRQGCFDNVFQRSAEHRAERGYHEVVGIFVVG